MSKSISPEPVSTRPQNEDVFRQGDRKPHLPALDGLRAIAILLVLFSHGAGDLPPRWFEWAASGWCGVDLFFVLSGFLITEGLLKTKGASNYFFSFYGKRFLRIFPVFYFALFAFFVVLPRLFHNVPQPPAPDQKYYWLYLNNWAALLQVTNIHWVGHFWSLAVEEQFYLLWPALVWLCSTKRLGQVAIGGILLAPLLRFGLLQAGVARETIYRNTFCQMDALMAGALCAVIVTLPRWRSAVLARVPQLAVAGLCLLAATRLAFGYSYHEHARMLILGLSFYTISFAAFVLYGLHPKVPKGVLAWRPLRYLALWSYGTYVYHLAIYYFVHRFLPQGRACWFLLEVSLSIAVAALSYHLAEEKILRGKKWFRPRYAG